MNYLNLKWIIKKTHAHSPILLDNWVTSLPSKESKDSFCPVQDALWPQDQVWAFCLLYAASHIQPLPALQFDPGQDSSGPRCPKWQTSAEGHSRNKSRLLISWTACFMGRGSQFPCALVSALALKADTFIRLSLVCICFFVSEGTHTYTHTHTLTHTPLYHRWC